MSLVPVLLLGLGAVAQPREMCQDGKRALAFTFPSAPLGVTTRWGEALALQTAYRDVSLGTPKAAPTLSTSRIAAAESVQAERRADLHSVTTAYKLLHQLWDVCSPSHFNVRNIIYSCQIPAPKLKMSSDCSHRKGARLEGCCMLFLSSCRL